MPSVTSITRSNAKTCAALLQFFYFCFCFQSNLVTPAAALHPFYQGHWLPMGCWHCLQSSPCGSMLAFFELFDSFLMAVGASLWRGNLYFVSVILIFMQFAVAYRTVDLILTVLAYLPVGNNIRRNFLVTIHTLLGISPCTKSDAHQNNGNRFVIQSSLPYF